MSDLISMSQVLTHRLVILVTPTEAFTRKHVASCLFVCLLAFDNVSNPEWSQIPIQHGVTLNFRSSSFYHLLSAEITGV